MLEFCMYRISSTIDIEASKMQGRFIAKAGCHGDLDELKYHYEGMNDFLNQVALEEGNALFVNMQHVISDITKLDLKEQPRLTFADLE